MRIHWAIRRSNQKILKEVNPEYSLEGLLLKLQYFGHLMQRVHSLEKTLMLGKTEGKGGGRERVRYHHQLNEHKLEQILGDSTPGSSVLHYSP